MRAVLAAALLLAAACSGGAGPTTSEQPSPTAPPPPSTTATTVAITSTTSSTSTPSTTPASTTTSGPDRPFLPEGRWQLIAGGDGLVALGGFDAGERPALVASTGDGRWEPLPLPPFEEGAIPLDLAADGRSLLLVLAGSTSELWRLDDGAAGWERLSVIGEPGETVTRALARDGGGWLLAGQAGASAALWRSADLAGWAPAPAPAGDLGDGGITGVAVLDGEPVVVGVDADGPFAAAPAGDAWPRVPLDGESGAQVLALLRTDAGLVGVGTDGGGASWTSADGTTWARGGAPDAFAFLDVAMLPEGIVALGLDRSFASRAWLSDDGVAWAALP